MASWLPLLETMLAFQVLYETEVLHQQKWLNMKIENVQQDSIAAEWH